MRTLPVNVVTFLHISLYDLLFVMETQAVSLLLYYMHVRKVITSLYPLTLKFSSETYWSLCNTDIIQKEDPGLTFHSQVHVQKMCLKRVWNLQIPSKPSAGSYTLCIFLGLCKIVWSFHPNQMWIEWCFFSLAKWSSDGLLAIVCIYENKMTVTLFLVLQNNK